jgi:hypothetical protein
MYQPWQLKRRPAFINRKKNALQCFLDTRYNVTEYGFLFSFYMRQFPTKTQIRIEIIVQNVHLEYICNLRKNCSVFYYFLSHFRKNKSFQRFRRDVKLFNTMPAKKFWPSLSVNSKKKMCNPYFIVIMITVLIMNVIFWVVNFKT